MPVGTPRKEWLLCLLQHLSQGVLAQTTASKLFCLHRQTESNNLLRPQPMWRELLSKSFALFAPCLFFRSKDFFALTWGRSNVDCLWSSCLDRLAIQSPNFVSFNLLKNYYFSSPEIIELEDEPSGPPIKSISCNPAASADPVRSRDGSFLQNLESLTTSRLNGVETPVCQI